MADNKFGLNSYALFTIAKTMREQNTEPNELMSYSEYGAASSTYAVINAMESLSAGLKAEEDRQFDAFIKSMRRDSEARSAAIKFSNSDGR